MTAALQLKHRDTAPKDGRWIIGDFGELFSPAIWNPARQCWIVAGLADKSIYPLDNPDFRFATEHEQHQHLNGWLPWPVMDPDTIEYPKE